MSKSKMFSDEAVAAMKARAAEVQRTRREYRSSVDAEKTFCTVDIGDWLALCKDADVPFIPATPVAEAQCEDLSMFDQAGEHQERLSVFWAEIEKVQKSSLEQDRHEMLRWSCCAGSDVKYHLGCGRPGWNPEFMETFDICDPRAYDLVHDFPKKTIQAWLRPWISLQCLDDYPIEFRVFVENNKIIGISSYYPQRPLPLTSDIITYISAITSHAEKMISRQAKPLNCPELRGFDITQNSWSADFAISENGEALFLEGGPPHTPTFGAHSCCFAVGEIEGIALRPRRGVAGDIEQYLAEDAA